MSISSIDEPVITSNDGKRALPHVDFDDRESSRPSRSCSRNFSRVLCQESGAVTLGMYSMFRPAVSSASIRARRRQQQIEQTLFGVLLGLVVDFFEPVFAHHVYGQFDEIAHHRLDIAADVADFGEFRSLDLDERRLREPRQPPRDLGLADACRPDHQNILRHDVFGELGREPLPPHAIAKRDRHGALRVFLADDVLVELGDDLPRRQRVHRGGKRFGKQDSHQSSSIASVPLV